MYHNYLPGSGKVVIALGMDNNLFTIANFTAQYNKLKKTTISINYPKVGYIYTDNSEDSRVEIGLRLTNMRKSPLGNASTYDTLYPNKGVIIDLASNLYSGMVVSGLRAADYVFDYYNVATGQSYEFSTNHDIFMSFKSLNAYGTSGCSATNSCLNGEFVKSTIPAINDTAQLATPTNISKGSRYFSNTLNTSLLTVADRQFNDVFGATDNECS